MPSDPRSADLRELEKLHSAVNRLLRKLSRQTFSTRSDMQLDAANALALVRYADPQQEALLQSSLSAILRELGHRRPDLHRHVPVLESAVVEMRTRLREAEGGEAG